MNEKDKLRRAFVASAVALVAVGIIFIVVTTVSLMHIGDAVEKAPTVRYNLNCLTQPIEKPLTECKDGE